MKERHREISKLYIQMYTRLFEYARSALPNDALAEEAVQDTFVIACQKIDDLLYSQNPPGWLVVTLKKVISNTIRKQQTAQRILAAYLARDSLDVAMSYDQLELAILYNDISKTEEFVLLKEIAIDGKSYKQMAEARGISIATCRKRVQRAKEKLKNKIHM